ncbi:MAG: Oar protein, partial [Methylotenera sp.]|nr:Oar protein [Methylotenera sp.]
DKSVQDDIYLQLADSLSFDIRLGGQTLEAVVVTGSSSNPNNRFASASGGAGTNLGRQELDAYASIARNLQDYARQDPRLSQTDKERGEISAGGQNSRYNSITVDGVKINDTFGLEANNLPTIKQPISIDAIQSVQVNISNYDVTQQGYTGANINAVTKSGTNDFKGSVYYVFRNDEMNGRRFNPTTNSQFAFLPFTEKTIGATLGGPIIKDKLFFFASYEELKSNRAQPEFGPVGSPLTNVAISQSAIDQAVKIANDKYGISAGTPNGPAPVSVKDALIKIDWNINENHRANIRYAKTEQAETNFGTYSTTGLNLTSWWWNQKKTIETVVGQWFADWTPNFSTELKLSNRDYSSVPQNNSNLPAIGLQFSGAAPAGYTGTNLGNRFLNFGTELSRQFNVLDTKTVDGYFGANWVVGDHEIKGGADYSNNKVYNAFFQNVNGNYTFGCINSSATFTYSFGTVTCGSSTPASVVEAAVLENFQKGRPLNYQVQVAATSAGLDAGIARWSMANTGLFLQDTWTINDKLTVTGGVRLDRISVPDRPTFNAAASAAMVAGSVNGNQVVRNSGGFSTDGLSTPVSSIASAQRSNSVTPDGQDLFQPRFDFKYTIDGKANQKKQVRGGFGLFQGAAANVWVSNPFSNTGLATKIVGCGTQGFPACDGSSIFNPDPTKQPTSFPGTPPAANVDFLDKSLTQPSVWKLNLAYDGELPWGGLVAGAEWVYTKTKTGVFYQHLNLGAPTRTGTDGRELYYTPAAYNPACWTSSGGTSTSGAACATSATNAGVRARALSNSSFNNVLLATSTDKGGGNAVTFSLSSPNKGGFGWQVAYTRTSATEVSPLTSSVSNSNFNSRSIFNPNENVAANSAYLIKDRFNASFNWSAAFIGKYKTTVGLFYEGRKGKPYSWTYRNDLNGDGVSGNDLMYIPSAPQSGEVVFLGDTATNRTNEDAFWAVVNANKALRDAKGGVVARNSAFMPFVNSFDVRVSQELPGFTSKHKGLLTLDILNIGNLINNRWGRINELSFASAGGLRRTFVNYVGLNPEGKYIYQVNSNVDSLTPRQVKGESQWAMQITAKYEF